MLNYVHALSEEKQKEIIRDFSFYDETSWSLNRSWDERMTRLANLSREERRNELDIVGDKYVASVRFYALLNINGKEYSVIDTHEFLVDDEEQLHKVANDFFLSEHCSVVTYYEEEATRLNGTAEFTLERLYSEEELDLDEEFWEELESFTF